MSPTPAHIQIICDTSLEYFRNVILGARHYAFNSGHILLNDHWKLHKDTNLQQLADIHGIQGIIAQVNDSETEARMLGLSIPVVNIGNVMLEPRLPIVTQDDYDAGRLAAEHLFACNCSAYLCCARSGTRFSEERVAGFRDRLRELAPNAPCIVLELPKPEHRQAMAHTQKIRNWLQSHAPLRPLGVFTVLDIFALYAIQALKQLEWSVPEHVAIMGAGDDDFLVNFENIPLSSISLPAYQIGYKAAQMIDRLLSGEAAPHFVHRLRPLDIIKRKSTDIIFVEDPHLARALAFIRESTRQSTVNVDAVVAASGLSRSVLQRRFRQQIGRSVRQEIQRSRIENAKDSLRSSNVKIAVIAEQNAFPSSQRFSVVFRKETGLTPDQYRKNLRGNNS